MLRQIAWHFAYESWLSWGVSRLLGDASGERVGAWIERRWLYPGLTAERQSGAPAQQSVSDRG